MNYRKYITFYTKALARRTRLASEYLDSVFEIDFERYEEKIDLVIFDFDDTLVDFHGSLNEKTTTFIQELKNKGTEVVIFSNCSESRAKELDSMLSDLDIFCVRGSDKPSPRGFVEAMEKYDIGPDRTMVVGDKLGTEIYGAFLAKVRYRILVRPYSEIFGGRKADVLNRIVRNLEKLIYFRRAKNEKKS